MSERIFTGDLNSLDRDFLNGHSRILTKKSIKLCNKMKSIMTKFYIYMESPDLETIKAIYRYDVKYLENSWNIPIDFRKPRK